MSDPKLISPMLDNFAMGDPISDHDGVRCCPAMEKDTNGKYIVKIISVPANQRQLDALLLSGAYASADDALVYFKSLADGVIDEVGVLNNLSKLQGFIPFEQHQVVPMDDGIGYDVYLLSTYKRTLQRYLRRHPMTHLGALNLGLDLCAALTTCRNNGLLYVDLKPENIYITDENEYKIGDLGFMRLDSLKYASLPDRYRSNYTAPEISDAYSQLNTTIDVYAVGLILYQVFNDGVLPQANEDNDNFSAPAYADYELAEIILKACNSDPEQRWENPEQMGQALVAYMQRNGAHDTPITPMQEAVEPEQVGGEEEIAETVEDTADTVNESNESTETADNVEEADAEVIDEADITEESIFEEDSEGNLTFISDGVEDETTPGSEETAIEYEELSGEVSDMLAQADELIEHPTPDPVVQPEPIDVPIPEPIVIEGEETDSDDQEKENDTETFEEITEDLPTEIDVDEDFEDVEVPQKPKRSLTWVRNVFLVLTALVILAAGFIFYKNYYLLPVESIVLEESEIGTITVLVNSSIDESKLKVVCSDTYGNKLSAPVVNGKAKITGLASNSAYSVKVVIDGFHRLTGDTSTAFTTPAQTNIVHLQVVTGSEEGSAVISFTVDGPDSQSWKVSYKAENEEPKEISFSGHMTTLTGLTVGTTYNITLSPEDNIHIIGETDVVHTASKIIKATDLCITGCSNEKLTATWSVPEGATVESWTVRCYNESGYDKTITVAEPSAEFEGVNPADSYTVEVTAAGMSLSERAFAAANSITVTNFNADISDPNSVRVSWDCEVPQESWILMYSIDGSTSQEMKCDSKNSAIITPHIPGADYRFTLKTADGSSVLGGILRVKTKEAEKFKGYNVTADHMEFKMCKTPKSKNWDRFDLSKSDYTTTFESGKKASFLIRMRHEYNTSKDKITSLFVIRDKDGNLVMTSTSTAKWTSMWKKNYCELDIPQIPTEAGNYTVSVYFNGALATTQSFTVK